MNDPQNKNESENIGSAPSIDEATSDKPVPDTEQVEPAEASEPELSTKTVPFSQESADSKPNKPPLVLAKPAEPPVEPPAEPMPAPAKVSVASRPTAIKPASSPVVDSSISIDGDRDQNVGTLIVDAIAASLAVAFTFLLYQEVIPFL